MMRALVRAHRWRRRIESGKAKSTTDLAAQQDVTDAYVCRLLPLTCLAPSVVAAIRDGSQTKGLKLAGLLRAHSDAFRPLFPNDCDHRFRMIATTCSEGSRPGG